MTLYFITDCDPDENTGGAIIRRGQISYLRKYGIDIVVVKPGFRNYYDRESQTVTISGLSQNSKFYYGLEAIGIVADKFIKWSNNVYSFLYSLVKPEDVLFTTSGGTLASIIAGAKIKLKTKAKLIINYHDPTDFTTLKGSYSRESKFPHVNRDKFEKKLINLSDYIITSSESYRHVLIEKYPDISKKSCCAYFGYIEPFSTTSNGVQLKEDNKLNIVYGGNFGPTQSPEILGLAANGLSNIKVSYVGNFSSNNKILQLGNEPNVELIPAKPLSEYLEYLDKYADVGFLSLRNNLTNYCVPSKLFDYINIGLPMIGLIKGDSKDIIEDNVYGCISEDSVNSLRDQLIKISDLNFLRLCKENILRDRMKWSMDSRIQKVVDVLENL